MNKIKEFFIQMDDWLGYNYPVLFVLYKTLLWLVLCSSSVFNDMAFKNYTLVQFNLAMDGLIILKLIRSLPAPQISS